MIKSPAKLISPRSPGAIVPALLHVQPGESLKAPSTATPEPPETPATAPAESAAEIPAWKRALDIILVMLAMPLVAPIMAAIVVYIRLVSPGPVIFRQIRVGQGGRRFCCLKFRSMHVRNETRSHEGHLEKLMRAEVPMTKLDDKNDPRLIRFGRLFRASGLDELPQLFNVLRGEMSLVGPRPCTPFEYDRYEAWQKRRFLAHPGLTGYWQVNGKNKTTFRQMIEMDIYYGEKTSLRFDLWVLFRTVPALVQQLIESRRKTAETAAINPSAPVAEGC